MNIYIDINSRITASSFISATIVFTIEKSWLTQQSIASSSVKLWRWNNNQWNPLVTTKVSETSTTVTFEAVSPGFSVFAVAGTKTVTPAEQPNNTNANNNDSTGTTTGTENTTGTPSDTTAGATDNSTPPVDTTPWSLIAIIVVVLILVGVFVWPKLGKKGW